MRVLWITNILLPEAVSIIKGEHVLKGSGGWMIGAAMELIKNGKVSLNIAAPSSFVSELTTIQGEQVTYYAFPEVSNIRKNYIQYEGYFREITKQVSPEVVHIHGTEFPIGLAYVRACGSKNVVASIQGMTSVICRYNTDGIPVYSRLKYITLSDLILRRSLFKEKRDLSSYGRLEIELIKELHFVIGRTSWDKAHTWAINPNIQYYHCNETLRSEFYEGEWKFHDCHKHTIFLSQPKNSVKGFHQLLKALPIVLERYPDTIVRIPGSLHLYPVSLKGQFLLTGYDRYLKSLIDKGNLKGHIVFLGPLSATQMREEYLSANVFVSCSSIENSSNSIAEAQILGTPCIASFVGGTDDMVIHGETGFLYRFEEVEMLAYYICDVFGEGLDLEKLSHKEVSVAQKRHNPKLNCEALLNIYHQIINDK